MRSQQPLNGVAATAELARESAAVGAASVAARRSRSCCAGSPSKACSHRRSGTASTAGRISFCQGEMNTISPMPAKSKLPSIANAAPPPWLSWPGFTKSSPSGEIVSPVTDALVARIARPVGIRT
jgi:hypothetical protein